MQTNISITGMGSISPLGADRANIWRQYLLDKPLLVGQRVGEELLPVGRLQEESHALVREIRQENARYRSVDPTDSMRSMPRDRPCRRQVGSRVRTLGSI